MVANECSTLQLFMQYTDYPRLASRPVGAIAVLIAGCLVVLTWWFARGVEVSLPTVDSADMQHLPCVSYSPFRYPDLNPFNYLAKVTPAQIEADLRILKTRTNCIRTYGLTQGLDAVPAVAKKLGMRVKLGVWLARDAAQNQAQLSQGLALARLYPGVIDLLIVGNEVLLRKELKAPQLAEILQQAKAQSPVPITYADVWEFWQRHSELAKEVDVVTVHILPYWEDEPVAVHDAAHHVREVGKKMQQHFFGKPVWIGETGWPAAGRQRDGAVPGKVEQSAFIRDLLLLRKSIPQDFNVIEAFDQPWKRSFEGAMGGYWGLFDAHGQARASLSGAVIEDAKWWRGLVGAGLGALLIALLAGSVQRWRMSAVLIGGFGGGMLGAVFATQLLMSIWWDRSPLEVAVSIGLGTVGAASAVLSLSQLLLASHPEDTLSRGSQLIARIADALRLALLFCAASAALVMLLDPRYRPFAWWWFLAPAVCWLALRLGAPEIANHATRQTQFLAFALALCSLGLMMQEGWRNAQALSYGVLLLALAVVAAWPTLAKTKAANSAAGALSSVE
jgi:exo-beta-1,3-glucanase (GH17 family)